MRNGLVERQLRRRHTPVGRKTWDRMRRPAMEVTLPADLRNQVERELASGQYRSPAMN